MTMALFRCLKVGMSVGKIEESPRSRTRRASSCSSKDSDTPTQPEKSSNPILIQGSNISIYDWLVLVFLSLTNSQQNSQTDWALIFVVTPTNINSGYLRTVKIKKKYIFFLENLRNQ